MAAPPSLPLPSPSTTTSPYTCIAVLEPTSDEASDICALAISSDGCKCLSCYEEHDAIWWDLSLPPRKQATEVSGLGVHAAHIAMSRDGMNLVLGGGTELQVWDAAEQDSRWLEVPGLSGDEEQGDEGEEDSEALSITCVAMTGDGTYMAAGGGQPSWGWLGVCDLDRHSNAPCASIDLPCGQLARVLSVSADRTCVTAISHENYVWSWEVGSKVLGGPVVLDGAGCFDQSAMCYDGRTAVAYKDKQVQVWDLTTGTLTATL